MSENQYTIRRAKESDYSFLADAILKADLGAEGQNSSYAALFGITTEQAREAIIRMMPEEMDGCEFSPVHFLVAEFEGKPVAAVASWIEGLESVSSNVARSALVQEYYPAGAIAHVQSLMKMADEIMVHRTNGTMQIESVFVEEAHRGQGLAAKLIKAHIAKAMLQNYDVEIVQLMTYSDNKKAIHAYEKMGFGITAEKHSSDPEVLKYFPGTGMVSMEADILKLMKQ